MVEDVLMCRCWVLVPERQRRLNAGGVLVIGSWCVCLLGGEMNHE